MPISERERRRDKDERPRDRSRSRSRSPRRYKKDDVDDKHRDRERERTRRRSRSPPPRRRHSHSRSRSPAKSGPRSESHSPRRDRDKERERGHERRSRSRSRHRHKRRRSRSVSSSPSDSDSADRHKRKKKDKHRRKRSRSREKKEKKKDKKDKKKKGAVSDAQWGKYGIINESNLYDKEAEFRTWLVEERVINPEVLSKDQTKKEFARFIEDFNTATLPHEKFYDMTAYDRRMSSMRHGETLPIVDGYDPNADLLAHSSAHKKPVIEKDVFMSKEQLQELRRVQEQRNQIGKMKLMGMQIGQTFGVRMDGSMFDG
ncbi:hypothetical protein M0805_009202 [Coniferiporia weirii]|nr:hypothetical protein M0805_009202 [Coniferiporia weirii]